MMKTVNEVSNNKTKLVCFTAELDEQIDSESMYMEAYYENCGCIPVCNQTIASVFLCFSRYFVVLDIHLLNYISRHAQ